METFKTIIPSGYLIKKTTIKSSYTPFITVMKGITATPVPALSGTIAGTVTFVGILRVRKLLSGVIICETTWLGTLKTGAQLAGNIAVDAVFAGTLSIGGIAPAQLVGDIPVDVTFAGLLTARQLMTGEIASDVAFAGTLKTGAKLVGDIAASVDFAGTLKAVAQLIGNIPVDATFGGTLKATAKLVGAIASDVTFACTLKTAAKLAGDIPVDVTFAGTLTAAGSTVLGLPSSSGFAKNASQSMYPSLWRGLVALWGAPQVGVQAVTLRDLSGRRNDGTLTNFAGGISATSGFFPGKRGMSLMFDGTNDYVDMGHRDDLHFSSTKQFTFIMWYFHGSTADRGLISKFSTGFRGYMIWNGGGGSNIDLYIDGGEVIVSAGTFTVGAWGHIAFTWDGATVRAYREGVLNASAGWSSIPESESGSFNLGRYAGGSYMNGGLADIRIYNRCLSGNEIKQCYSGASPLKRKK